MTANSIIDLDGEWALGWFDGARGDRAFRDEPARTREDWFKAAVPGEVHRQLEAQGILMPIESGLGALAARWVDDVIWYLSRDFVVGDHDVAKWAELVFDRVELDANVYLNGELVATHCSAFLPLRVDVTGRIVAGTNSLRVELNGGLRKVGDLPARGYRHSEDQTVTKRHWLRTGQSQFGWDWAPRLVVAGITESVRLELRTHSLRIDEVVPLVRLSDDLRAATVRCRVVCSLAGDQPEAVELRVAIPRLGVARSCSAVATPGTSIHELAFEVTDPELWWPRGMGGQPLYELTVDLTVADAAADNWARSIGFRSIVVDQSPSGDGGRRFQIIVNGVEMFAKGANWVPLSLTPHPVDRRLLETQLDQAVAANFNFLRVWGGGDYESEEFYQGCDKRGLLVWQDFIFACSRYPLSVAEFHREIMAEATHQVRRLARHPSLAIWAGNNEIAWMAFSANREGSGLVLSSDGVSPDALLADHEFFVRDLPALLAVEDPTRHYQPSSPWSPEDPDHNAFSEGDQHPWQIGFENVDFLEYREMTARFPNEGGLLGPPTLQSVLDSLPEGQRFYNSFAWKQHDNEIAQRFVDRPMDRLLKRWTGLDITRAGLDEYVYWTGLVQGEALTEYIDNFRRRFGTSSSAAVFWMYNDCWPTVRSWSIVDSSGRRNPAFWAVRRAFQPVRVIIARENGQAVVHACNDTTEEVEAELEWGTCFLSRKEVQTRRCAVRVPPGRSCVVGQVEVPADAGRELVSIALLRAGGRVLAANRLLEGPFAELPWSEPEIEVTMTDGQATFTSPVFVLGTCIDLDGETGVGDNFFDLYPGVPHTVPWDRSGEPRILFTGNPCHGQRGG